MRFETAAGEQAQVDWGSLPYVGEDGKLRRVWVFMMTMGWSRACYVELVRRADTAAFIQCHANAFEYLGGVPRRCLYDNAKVVTLGRDEDGQVEWNPRMLDEERAHLGKLPERATLSPYLREDRKVARDGFVSWEDSRYGGSTGNGWEGRCRWASVGARWRSGRAMRAHRGASPGPAAWSALHPARPVGGPAPGRQSAPPGGGGGAGPGG